MRPVTVNSRTCLCGLALACVVALPAVATAQSAEPDAAAPSADSAGYLPYAEPRPLEGVSVWGALGRSVGALGIVLGLLGGSILLTRRFLPGVAAGGATNPVRVVGRVALGPKQTVFLLQVPGRILLVGSGGGQLATLAEISDPDDVAQLLHAAPGRLGGGAAGFGGVLHRYLGETTRDAPASAGPTSGADVPIDAIRRRIASLRALGRTESP